MKNQLGESALSKETVPSSKMLARNLYDATLFTATTAFVSSRLLVTFGKIISGVELLLVQLFPDGSPAQQYLPPKSPLLLFCDIFESRIRKRQSDSLGKFNLHFFGKHTSERYIRSLKPCILIYCNVCTCFIVRVL